ncbi:MAG: integrase core domain-containing protein [Acidimicrobiales bacterium]
MQENPNWGDRCIHGELATIGIAITASNVWAILKRHGIHPWPRTSGPTGAELLATQAIELMACDFFHIDTVSPRNLSMDLAEQASAVKLLIRDRATKFTVSFDVVFAADGVRIVKSPVRAPRANSICERVIGTLRHECRDPTLILGRRDLETVLTEYVEHYNTHRPHRSPSQRGQSALPSTAVLIGDGPHQPTKNRSSGPPQRQVRDGRLSWADGVLGTHR